MTDAEPPAYVAAFRLVHLFNVWALTVALGLLVAFALGAGGGLRTVPDLVWGVVIVDGTLFALYFLLSAPVATFLESRDAMPRTLARLGATLERWDEAGRE